MCLTCTASRTLPRWWGPSCLSSTRCKRASGPPACKSIAVGSAWQHRTPSTGPAYAPLVPNAAAAQPWGRWISFRCPAKKQNSIHFTKSIHLLITIHISRRLLGKDLKINHRYTNNWVYFCFITCDRLKYDLTWCIYHGKARLQSWQLQSLLVPYAAVMIINHPGARQPKHARLCTESPCF